MAILVGSTGFVGGHLSQFFDFEYKVNRENLKSISGIETDLIVCAGLPAQKWSANLHPHEDWSNMSSLAQVLSTVTSKRAVLVSTIDVYQPAICVDETSFPNFLGEERYGVHRAWFESFFKSQFPNALVLRLPALFAHDVRKNLIHDLLHGKEDQWSKVNPKSTFQWFDVSQTWEIIERAWEFNVSLLNVSSEPITSQEIASLFGKRLKSDSKSIEYNMKSIHAEKFGGHGGYIYDKTSVLEKIANLRNSNKL